MSNRRGAQPAPRPTMTAADIIGLTSPITRSMPICLDGRLRAEYDQAQNAAKQIEQALVQAQRQMELIKAASKSDAPTFVGAEDQPLSGVGDDPLPADAQTLKDQIRALRRELAARLAAEESARAALVAKTYEFVVRAYPGGETERIRAQRAHQTGEPRLMWRVVEGTQDVEPVPAGPKTPEAHQRDGYRILFGQEGQPLREYEDERGYYADLLAVCLVDPKMNTEEARAFIDALDSDTTIGTLAGLIQIATNEAATVPFSRTTTPPS